jgi:hypothetical protein
MMDTASRTAPPLVRVADFTTNRACRQGIHNNSCPGGGHWLGLGFEEVLLLCGYAPVMIIKYETAPPSRRLRIIIMMEKSAASDASVRALASLFCVHPCMTMRRTTAAAAATTTSVSDGDGNMRRCCHS